MCPDPGDEPRKLTSEEQREQMKQQFKKDLRERQDFLKKVEHLRKQQNILNALEGMTVEDDSEEWIRKLNEESAIQDAKADIALEGLTGADPSGQVPALTEAEMRKLAAEQMVAELKKQMQQGLDGGVTGSGLDLDASKVEQKKQEPPADETQERPIRRMIDGLE